MKQKSTIVVGLLLVLISSLTVVSCSPDAAGPPGAAQPIDRVANSDATQDPCIDLVDCNATIPAGSCYEYDSDTGSNHACDLFPMLGANQSMFRAEALRLIASSNTTCQQMGQIGLSKTNGGQVKGYGSITYGAGLYPIMGDTHAPGRHYGGEIHIYMGVQRTEDSMLRTFRHELAHWLGYSDSPNWPGDITTYDWATICYYA